MSKRYDSSPSQPKPRPPGSKTPRRSEPNPMALAGAGFELVAAAAMLALLGWWLDGKWGTTPWLLVTGLGLGVVSGTYRIWLVGKRFFR